jgi:hypothetical protein
MQPALKKGEGAFFHVKPCAGALVTQSQCSQFFIVNICSYILFYVCSESVLFFYVPSTNIYVVVLELTIQ